MLWKNILLIKINITVKIFKENNVFIHYALGKVQTKIVSKNSLDNMWYSLTLKSYGVYHCLFVIFLFFYFFLENCNFPSKQYKTDLMNVKEIQKTI